MPASDGLGIADELGEETPVHRSLLDYIRPVEHGLDAQAFSLKNLKQRGTRIGLVSTIILIQLFFYLESIVASPILPGDWTSFSGDFGFYLLFDVIALFILGTSNRIGKIQGGGFGGFSITYVLFAAGTWLLTAGLLSYGTAPTIPISQTTQLQDFVFYGIFVGPTEELLFRVALPPHVPGGWVTANIAFAVFHIFAYTSTGLTLGFELYYQLFFVFLLGVIFYFIYQYFGYGAAVGTHTAYDLATVGAIVLGFSGLHLGIVPV